MKKIFTIIGSILAIVIVSGAIIAAPGIAERQRIARSRIANYKNDRYIGLFKKSIVVITSLLNKKEN